MPGLALATVQCRAIEYGYAPDDWPAWRIQDVTWT